MGEGKATLRVLGSLGEAPKVRHEERGLRQLQGKLKAERKGKVPGCGHRGGVGSALGA